MPWYIFKTALIFSLLSYAERGFSCAVCGAVSDSARRAYIETTALLSLLPLAVIGGIIYYVYRAHFHKS
jgi:hypothetical protein